MTDERSDRRLDQLELALRAVVEALDATSRNPRADAAINRAKQHLNQARQLGERRD